MMLPWHSPETWARLKRGEGCPLCDSVARAEAVAELDGGWVRVPRMACLPGYAVLVAHRHAAEWHDLTEPEAAALMADIRRLSAAVQRVTGAAKINLLSLGNLVPHVHVHVCPRQAGDRVEGRPLDPGDTSEHCYADTPTHAAYVSALVAQLKR